MNFNIDVGAYVCQRNHTVSPLVSPDSEESFIRTKISGCSDVVNSSPKSESEFKIERLTSAIFYFSYQRSVFLLGNHSLYKVPRFSTSNILRQA